MINTRSIGEAVEQSVKPTPHWLNLGRMVKMQKTGKSQEWMADRVLFELPSSLEHGKWRAISVLFLVFKVYSIMPNMAPEP